MLKFKKKKACIIGLGKIGIGYDRISSSSIKTHYKSIKNSKYFELSGIVDKKKINDKRISSVPIYKNVKDLSKNLNPYLVIISVPTKDHFSIFKEVMKYLKPKIILCEKPFTSNIDEAKKLVLICKKKKIKLYVNYIRNYLPNIYKIKKALVNKKSTCFLNISGNFKNNFCHYFYFLQYLFNLSANPQKNEVNKLFENCTLVLKRNNIKQIDNLKIISKDFKLSWKNNNIINIMLKKKIIKINVDLDNYQHHVLNNIAKNTFFNGKKITILGSEALKFHQIFND